MTRREKLEELIADIPPSLQNIIRCAFEAGEAGTTILVMGIDDGVPLLADSTYTDPSILNEILGEKPHTDFEKRTVRLSFSNQIAVGFLMRDVPLVMSLLSRELRKFVKTQTR